MEEANGSKSHGAAKDTKSDNTANGNHAATKSKDSTPISSTTPTHGPEGANKSPRKRRKVNHGMLCSAAKFSGCLSMLPSQAGLGA